MQFASEPTDKSADSEARPLVIDLDGTLVKSDLLFESYFNTVLSGVSHHLSVAGELRRGKAPLKALLAGRCKLEYATLPYDQAVLELARKARSQGRRVYLATASDERHANAIAAHLGLFDGVFASDGDSNLASLAKAKKLVEVFGDRGFDYVGNGAADVAVWAHAAKAYAVRTSPPVRSRLAALGVPFEHLESTPASLTTWLRAIRVHQYAKNALVFVPLLTAHAFTARDLFTGALAFIAFSACASSVYLLNDLVDLDADRLHPTKRSRPLASGEIPIAHAVLAIPVLLLFSILCAFSVSPAFLGVLAGYYAITTAYSFYLKRKMLIDVVALAMLYTVRVIGGAVAIDVVLSEWLFAFSIFVFTSLALIKRYVELTMRADSGLSDPGNRNYKIGDVDVIAALAAASGMNAITIFTLYVSSPAVAGLYHRPALLWLICPILLYWLARALMMAHRRLMNDDPVVFALRDRVSRWTVILMTLIVLLAAA
jgi:4-hydroxybenzoate polyprenyltransferase/phosphoserine phosphatase